MSNQTSPPTSEFTLVAQIERRNNQPDLCTVYQSGTDDVTKMSRWITAKGDAFLNAQSVR